MTRARISKGRCPWCKKPVYRNAYLFWNVYWHRGCFYKREADNPKLPATYTGDRG